MEKLKMIACSLLMLLGVSTTLQSQVYSEEKKLTASDAQGGDLLGTSVSISGDLVIVGASREDGVISGIDAGAAYIFQESQAIPGLWTEMKKLTASDGADDDQFGTSVAISGEFAVVGSPQHDGSGLYEGAAYLYQKDLGGLNNWGMVAKLVASDKASNDRFGVSVAISGETIIVGAPFEDEGGTDAGAVYIFDKDQGGPGNWGVVKKVYTADAGAGARFGFAVSISGDIIAVGAPRHDGAGSDRGAAYLFERNLGGASAWTVLAKLTASDAGDLDQLGFSVSISGSTVAAGANKDDDGGANAGAAYVYQENLGGVGTWGEASKLKASDAQSDDEFGMAIAVSDTAVVVGCRHEDGTGSNRGAAYVFAQDQGGALNWGEVQKIESADIQNDDEFGASVGISANQVVVGATGEADGGANAGAAYIFSAPSTGLFDLTDPLPIRTYYNASLHTLNLEVEERVNGGRIMLFSALGQLVRTYSLPASPGRYAWSVNKLNPGVYLLYVSAEQGVHRTRFIRY